MPKNIYKQDDDIKNVFFQILKTEQKVKKWKDSVSSIHFGDRIF